MTERIKIIRIPPGEAPEWVRNEWVGLELPIEEGAPSPEEGVQFGVRGGKPENLGGYPIRTIDAIDTLRKKSPRAAVWWETHLPLELIPRLVFKRDACAVVPDIPDKKS